MSISHAPRRYCEYNNGHISRTYLKRTFNDPQHHIRTDRIGSRYAEWSRKDTLDLQCSTEHTKQLIRDREDQLWKTNPKNREGVDPLANSIGWYSGHIDHTAWIERKVRCHRRIRPASELRNRKRNSALRQAYQTAKAQRETQEGEDANVLTPHEQGRIKALGLSLSYLALAEAKRKAETEASEQKEQRAEELQSILASLATGAPAVTAPELIPIVPTIQMHPDRLAQLLAPASVYQLGASVTKDVESRAEGRRRRELKARRAKAKLEGRTLEDDERLQDDPRGGWHAPGYELV